MNDPYTQALTRQLKNPGENGTLRSLFPIFWSIDTLEQTIREGKIPPKLEKMWIRHSMCEDTIKYLKLLKQSRFWPRSLGVIAILITLLLTSTNTAILVGLTTYLSLHHYWQEKLSKQRTAKRRIDRFLESLNWLTLGVSVDDTLIPKAYYDVDMALNLLLQSGDNDLDRAISRLRQIELVLETFVTNEHHMIGYDSGHIMTPGQAEALVLKALGAERAILYWTLRN